MFVCVCVCVCIHNYIVITEEVTYADDSRETHADNPRRTHADDPRVTQYAVLCSEVLCKVR